MEYEMIIRKPPALRLGDVIGIVSPSGGLAQLVPHRVAQAEKMLQKMGFKTLIGSNALKKTGYTAGTAEERAADINDFFANQEVKAIICFIGGFHSNQLLKHLNFELIKENPKVFCGFSDVSVLHVAFYTKAQISTFYGPAVLTHFGEPFGMDAYTREYFERATMRSDVIGQVFASAEWTDEFLDWFKQADMARPRRMFKNSGYKWLKNGAAEGVAIGGCITSIIHLRGTEFWPDFSGAIFFWEIPESAADPARGEPVSRIDAYLTDLELSGVFQQCNGMIVGRPKGYTDEDMEQLEAVILERTRDFNMPILMNVNIGHADPIITLPYGICVRIDSSQNLFAIIESSTVAD
jgi:muramoyltetrapeptide carboxypeptidase